MVLFVIGMLTGAGLTIIAISVMIYLTKDVIYRDMLEDLQEEESRAAKREHV